MNEVLNCRSLFKSYLTGEKKIEVLKGLDLEILEGEMVAIIGESGVGKSTLLHILGAIDPPDSGQVRLRGEEIFSKNHLELSRFRNRGCPCTLRFIKMALSWIGGSMAQGGLPSISRSPTGASRVTYLKIAPILICCLIVVIVTPSPSWSIPSLPSIT